MILIDLQGEAVNDTRAEVQEQVIDLFEQFDKDGDGQIDEGEFREVIEALGGSSTDEVLSLEFAAIDINGDERVGLLEFMDWWLDYE